MTRRKTRPVPLSQQEREALGKIDRLLRQVRTEFGPQISARRVQALVAVGLHGAAHHLKIAAMLHANDHTVWTDMQALGPLDRHGQTGYEMLEDRGEADAHRWHITPKGEAVLDRLAATLQGPFE